MNPKRILVVDDTPDVRDIIVEQVRFLGYEVEEAECGQAALALVAQGGFDLVITDFDMPEMDGVELTSRVKSEYPAVKIIFASSGVTQELNERAWAAGADMVLPKPFTGDELRVAIAKLLN
ncbi:MAG: response regulator [bacterium]|nr:response regulator [bacterium]